MSWYYIILILVLSFISYVLIFKKIYYRYDNKLFNTIKWVELIKNTSNYSNNHYNYVIAALEDIGISYNMYTKPKIQTLVIMSDVLGVIYEYNNGRKYFHKKLKPLYNTIINIKKDVGNIIDQDRIVKTNNKEKLLDEYLKDFNIESFKVHRKLNK